MPKAKQTNKRPATRRPKRTHSKPDGTRTPRPPTVKNKDLSVREMKKVLIKKFGYRCWGCDFIAPRPEYLQLDHMDPKSLGGSDNLDNRALLCPPCNGLKSNTKTMTGLRIENLRKGHAKTDPHPINIPQARKWCRNYIKD